MKILVYKGTEWKGKILEDRWSLPRDLNLGELEGKEVYLVRSNNNIIIAQSELPSDLKQRLGVEPLGTLDFELKQEIGEF